MGAVYSVAGRNFTQAQAVMLIRLVKGSVSPVSGYERNTLEKLEERGAAEVDDDARATITAKGREVVVALNAKVNGGGQPVAPTKPVAEPTPSKSKRAKRRPLSDGPTGRATKRISPEAGGTPLHSATPLASGPIDLASLRARIVASYERDLAACDRMIEFAEAEARA